MSRIHLALVFPLALASCAPCVEASYEGKATDEAYRALIDAEKHATTDDSKAALVMTPVSGTDASLAGAPLTVEWTTGLTALAPPPALPPEPTPFRWTDLLVSSAWAHGTPMAGPGHLIRLKVPGLACPVEHLSSLTSWTVSGAEWLKLADFKNKTLTIEIVSAYFASNRVTEGPYLATAPPTVHLVP